jgi:hypothetical protein
MRKSKAQSKRQKEARRVTGAIMNALTYKLYVEKIKYMPLDEYMSLEERISREVEAVL